MEWLLIAWIGSSHGGPTLERFVDKEDCERAYTVLVDVSGLKESAQTAHQCIQVKPLTGKPDNQPTK